MIIIDNGGRLPIPADNPTMLFIQSACGRQHKNDVENMNTYTEPNLK